MTSAEGSSSLEEARDLFFRGLGYMSQRQFEVAADTFCAAIKLAPERISLITNYSASLLKLGRYELALEVIDRGLLIDCSDPQLLVNRGLVFFGQKRFQDAYEQFSAALDGDPSCVEALLNRAAVLSDLNRPLEAMNDLATVRRLKGPSPEVLLNEGVVFTQLREELRAIQCFDQAISLDSDFIEARWNKALGLLRLGQLQEGWSLYESRWSWEGFRSPRRNFGVPQWSGHDGLLSRDLRLLVHAEQGLGDTLQFCRYVPELMANGVKVVFEVQKPLVSLMKRMPGVAEVAALGESHSNYDAHIPLLSLPKVFGTTLQSIPEAGNQLARKTFEMANFEPLFCGLHVPIIGITWRGNREGDHNRSIPLDLFKTICCPDYGWVAIQQEILVEESLRVSHMTIRDASDYLLTFEDTANLLQRLDLVITIDTSVAHLAGVLGHEVWVLLPFVPDFRWMWDREDSPWYPSMRLFRQPKLGDWESVLVLVRRELERRFERT